MIEPFRKFEVGLTSGASVFSCCAATSNLPYADLPIPELSDLEAQKFSELPLRYKQG